MIFYLLYRTGHFLGMALPLKVSYAIACGLADMLYVISRKDRRAVLANLRVIVGPADERILDEMARGVFRNFAKYLVDFFRFEKVDEEYVKKFVKIEGLENVDMARTGGNGVIVLSAHLGNWELGGLVLSICRHPLSAVVLTHKNKNINDFFRSQRGRHGMIPLETGMALRSCYNLLRSGGLLAILGDRDFTRNGFYIDFFGRPTMIPKGPAVFANRLNAPIVPCFMTRERDDTFRLIFEEPIMPEVGDDDASMISVARKYSAIIESYVRRYPTQWYMFREVWNGDKLSGGPDTVI